MEQNEEKFNENTKPKPIDTERVSEELQIVRNEDGNVNESESEPDREEMSVESEEEDEDSDVNTNNANSNNLNSDTLIDSHVTVSIDGNRFDGIVEDRNDTNG
eukprot:UN08864